MDNMFYIIIGVLLVNAFYCFRGAWKKRNYDLLEMRIKMLEAMVYPYISAKHELMYAPDIKRKAGRPPGSKNKKPRGHDAPGTGEMQ